MMAPELMPKLLELLLELVPRAGTVALLQTLRGPPRSEYRIVGCAFPLFPYCRDDLRGDGGAVLQFYNVHGPALQPRRTSLGTRSM